MWKIQALDEPLATFLFASPKINVVGHVALTKFNEIAYGFDGPSEKMSVLINFLLQNTNLVSVLGTICLNFATHV